MAFLSPWFLVGAATAALPIVLHLLRRAPELRVKFAAVRLLQAAPAEQEERRRLRELLLLALRVAALVLLALAFSRPFFGSAAGAVTGATIIALDTSLSMGPAKRFDTARRLAREAIASAPAGHLVGVVTFADTAVVAVAPTADRQLAMAAVDAATPGLGGTRYRGAFTAASGLLATQSPAESRIVLVTDLQERGWMTGDEASVPKSTRLEVADVGAPLPNRSVLDVRRAGDRIVAEVRGTGGPPQQARVHLTVDDRPAGSADVLLTPSVAVDVGFPATSGGVSAVVSVDDPEGIEGDNKRYVVLDRSLRPVVLIVNSGGPSDRDAFYLHRALAAARGEEQYDVQGTPASGLNTWDTGKFDSVVAVFLVSTRGLDHRARELLTAYMRRGGGVIVSAGPDVDEAIVNELLGGTIAIATSPGAASSRADVPRRLVPVDGRHPLFAVFGSQVGALSLVTFSQFATLQTAGCQPLARFTTGEPALVDCALGEGRAIVFASDFDKRWNDFPLSATFVPFLHETIRYVSGARRGRREYLIGHLPSGVPAVPGIVKVPGPVSDAGLVAVNVDPGEVDAGRLTTDQLLAAVTRSSDVEPVAGVDALRQESRQRLWQYALALMLVVLIGESMVAARVV